MRDGVMIPVVIGVTGHRDLRGKDKEKLRAAVRGELEALRSKCPHSPLLLMTGLAEGADRILASDLSSESGAEGSCEEEGECKDGLYSI